eukprot:1674162-Rhodomonas_salina.2
MLVRALQYNQPGSTATAERLFPEAQGRRTPVLSRVGAIVCCSSGQGGEWKRVPRNQGPATM